MLQSPSFLLVHQQRSLVDVHCRACDVVFLTEEFKKKQDVSYIHVFAKIDRVGEKEGAMFPPTLCPHQYGDQTLYTFEC